MLPADIRSRTTNPFNLPVDDCMFSNFIRTQLTCGSTLTNYASMPLNCIRTLSNYTPNAPQLHVHALELHANVAELHANVAELQARALQLHCQKPQQNRSSLRNLPLNPNNFRGLADFFA